MPCAPQSGVFFVLRELLAKNVRAVFTFSKIHGIMKKDFTAERRAVFAKKVKSYAKVNLSLNILGQKDGYHLIDSVVANIDVWDTVCAKPRSDRLINVYMHGLGSENIPPEKNNAVKAGEAFVSAFGTKGADIEIYKDIPMGAGLGGSSADAAGVLNVLAKLYKVKDRAALKSLADALGSDTGYMLSGGFARIAGRGEKVQPLDCKRRLYMLLFLPGEGVSSGECYREYDRCPDAPRTDSAGLAQALSAGDFSGIAENVYNALGAPAARLSDGVKEALSAAASFNPSAYAVTGSGSGVFALFEGEELCRWAKSRYKGKLRTRVVRTVMPKDAKVSRLASPFALTEEEISRAKGEDE